MVNKKIPQHVAIIMDGNGRWAKFRGKPRWFGHRAGAKNLETIIKAALKNNIKILSVFAFGIENWQRPKKEVSYLMKLFLISLQKYITFLQNNDIKLQIVGDINSLSKKHIDLIKAVEQETINNKSLCLNVAISYSGRWDILNATKNILTDISSNKLNFTQLNEKTFADYLQLGFYPDIDLFIRTGAEKRLSNFFLWQLAYSELYFIDQFWPDFNEYSLEQALQFYASRIRRFGRIDDQI